MSDPSEWVDDDPLKDCDCPDCMARRAGVELGRKTTLPNGREIELVGTLFIDEITSGSVAVFFDTREIFCDLWPGEEMYIAGDGDRRLDGRTSIPIRKSRWRGLRKLLRWCKLSSDER